MEIFQEHSKAHKCWAYKYFRPFTVTCLYTSRYSHLSENENIMVITNFLAHPIDGISVLNYERRALRHCGNISERVGEGVIDVYDIFSTERYEPMVKK